MDEELPLLCTAVVSSLWASATTHWDIHRHSDFLHYVKTFLATTPMSSSVIYLGLDYMRRFCDAGSIDDEDEMATFAVALRLAYKYLEDGCVPAVQPQWLAYTRFTASDLAGLELEFLQRIYYSLDTTEEAFSAWTTECYTIMKSYQWTYTTLLMEEAAAAAAEASPPLLCQQPVENTCLPPDYAWPTTQLVDSLPFYDSSQVLLQQVVYPDKDYFPIQTPINFCQPKLVWSSSCTTDSPPPLLFQPYYPPEHDHVMP